MDLLDKKTALITGGSDGIGFAIAKSFAEQGANLIIIGRDPEKLLHKKERLKQYNTSVTSITADISDEKTIITIAEKVKSKNIMVDIIVNNAGIGRFVPFRDTGSEKLHYYLNLNLKAPYLLTQMFIDDLTTLRGNVINISSYFAKRMLPDRPSTAYSLTKGGIESFTKALAFELGPEGVRVNAIAPGTVETQQVKYNFQQLNDKARERFNSMIKTIYPLQKTGKPEDIAEMAVFLASDKARWITGGIFPVDGGLTTN